MAAELMPGDQKYHFPFYHGNPGPAAQFEQMFRDLRPDAPVEPDTNAELLKEIRGLRADLARQRWLPDTPLVRKILAELEQRD